MDRQKACACGRKLVPSAIRLTREMLRKKFAEEVAIMKNSSVKYVGILVLAASSCAFAQDGGKTVILRSGGPVAGPVRDHRVGA